MAGTTKSARREISDRPTSEEAADYLARQPSWMGMPDGPLRTVLDRFVAGRRKHVGPANFDKS